MKALKMTSEVIQETIGNRQGGYSSADEWKVYGNPMIKELEENAVEEDFINGAVTNVIAVADDVAPCAVGDSPIEKHCIECRYSSILLKFMEYKTI
jgi:hypothetical protein